MKHDYIHPLWVERVKDLNKWQQLTVYMHYYCTMLYIKHNFEVNWEKKKAWSKPDKKILGVNFYFLWKDMEIKDFDNFISDKNINIQDYGEDWKRHGYAERHTINYFGIYDWYWKYAMEFNF